MSEFLKIATVQELPQAGEAQEFYVADRLICVANVNGEYCALDDVCPHRGGPLGQGFVDGTKIVCPWHGWEIEAKTGEANGHPAVSVYELRVEGDDVLVKL
jgi:nitrite reductase (NADH) small subunit